MNKRILLMTSTFPRWKNDTVTPFVYDFSVEISKLGFDIDVLAPFYPGAKKSEKMNSLSVHRFRYFFKEGLTESGILSSIAKNPLSAFQVPFFVLSELIGSNRLMKQEDFGGVCSHWIIPQGLIGAILSKIYRKKHTVVIHAGGLMALKKLPFKKQITNFILKNSDKVVCVSNFLGNELKKMTNNQFNNKIKIISMGIYSKKYKRKNTKFKDFTVLFIGRLVKKKGIEYLIEAARGLDCQLLIVGKGPLENKLKRQASKMNNVKFFGWVNSQEKITLLGKSHILVVPSINDKIGDTEGLGLVILEAFASGTPVIASPVGGIPQIVINGKTGLLAKEKDSGDLRKKIIKLKNSRKLQTRYANNSLKLVKEYDWRIIAGKFARILNGKA